MQLTFNPFTLSPREAALVIRMLRELHPETAGQTELPLDAPAEQPEPAVAATPPPPPAPTAELPSAPPPPPAPAAEELDAAGVPWNADLHASNKSKKSDGTWKAKRGLAAAHPTPPPPAPAAAAAVPSAPPPPPAPTEPAGAVVAATEIAALLARVMAAGKPNIMKDVEVAFGAKVGDIMQPTHEAMRPAVAEYLRGQLQ